MDVPSSMTMLHTVVLRQRRHDRFDKPQVDAVRQARATEGKCGHGDPLQWTKAYIGIAPWLR
jgi:hypothetical protein